MTSLAAWTYANNQNSSLLPLYCTYTNGGCWRMQSYWELHITQRSQCPGILVWIITTSDFWDHDPGSLRSHLHDERCRILWMRKSSHANHVMCGHGPHLQNTSLNKTTYSRTYSGQNIPEIKSWRHCSQKLVTWRDIANRSDSACPAPN